MTRSAARSACRQKTMLAGDCVPLVLAVPLLCRLLLSMFDIARLLTERLVLPDAAIHSAVAAPFRQVC